MLRRPRFYADQNFPNDLVGYLRRDAKPRVNVWTAADKGYASRDDEFHFAFAAQNGRILLTIDDDYLDNRRFPLQETAGLVVFTGFTNDSSAVAQQLFHIQFGLYRYIDADDWIGTKIKSSVDQITVFLRNARGKEARGSFLKSAKGFVWKGSCPQCDIIVAIPVEAFMECPECEGIFDSELIYE
jgi:Domain of unknown function (DUF5615)